MKSVGGILFFQALLFLPIFFSSPSFASDWKGRGPLLYRTQNPIYLEFLNPEPDRADSLVKGELNLSTYMQYSNVFEVAQGAGLAERLDMEVMRVVLSADYGIGDGLEVGIDLPMMYLYGGFLDPFIQKFHNIFGLPNGGRESVPNNQFTYRISELDAAGNELPIYQVGSPHFGFSDLIIHLKKNFIDEGRTVPEVAFLFYFKVPTGERSKGTGNGGIDYGFAAALEKTYKRFHGYVNLGYYVTEGHVNLDSYLNHQYFSGMGAIEFSISHPVSVIAQVHGGTPLTKGMGRSEWDSFPLDLIIGFEGYHEKLLMGQDFFWQIGFAEDLNSGGPSIDFTALVNVGIRFGGDRWASDTLALKF